MASKWKAAGRVGGRTSPDWEKKDLIWVSKSWRAQKITVRSSKDGRDYQGENNRHERKREDRCGGISEQKRRNSTWTDRMNNTNRSERDSWVNGVLMNLTRCFGASCVHAARRHQGFCLAGCPADHRYPAVPKATWERGGPRQRLKTTQAFQSGTNRVYRAAEQPSSHSPHHVSGSLAFTGFVGRKIWVYVCTYNIWQQGGIQIQLRRMLFAWVTVLAVDLIQRLLSEKLFLDQKKYTSFLAF